MIMTAIPEYSTPRPAGLVGLYRRVIKLPERIPFSLVQLAARVALAHGQRVSAARRQGNP